MQVTQNQEYKLCPLTGEKSKSYEKIFHLETNCQIINENLEAQCSLVDAYIKRSKKHFNFNTKKYRYASFSAESHVLWS